MKLHEVLDVTTHTSPDIIQKKWKHKAKTPKQERAYQLLLNQRYRRLYEKTFDERLLEKAGFFVESSNLKTDPKFVELFPRTPEGDVVLIITGSFDPVHDGHISAMETARKVIEKQNRSVALGIISPGHDDYAKTKRSDSYSIDQRIRLLEERIHDHPWLYCGRWESLGNSSSVNFTSVIDFYKELFPNKSIVYVFGEDNKYFSYVFDDPFEWVCIKRNAIQDASITIPMESHGKQHLSSTMIRANNALLNP